MLATELTTDQKGAVAEAEIAAAAIKLGVGVFKPLSDGERYDLILDVRPQLLRVQCKWEQRRHGVIAVPLFSARRVPNGFRKLSYDAAEIDAIAAYCLEIDRSFFIPVAALPGRTYMQLRLEPCRNNQRTRVNWGADYDFGARLAGLVGP